MNPNCSNSTHTAVSSIFHYTDAAGLLGILSSKSLFATHYKFLNDLTEAAAIRELIMPILESEVAEITPQLIEKRWLNERYYGDYGTGIHRLEAENLYGSFVRAIDNVSPFFVTSFCRHDMGTQPYEHGLLSQWRAYANTVGFAIEFDEQQLDSLLTLETASHAYAGFKSAEVRYEKYEQDFDAKIYKGLAREMIRGMFDHAKIDVSSVTGHADIDAVGLEFAKSAPFFKHRRFVEEREYRIAAVCLRAGKVPDGEKRPTKQINFRVKDGLIIPYIKLFAGLDKSLPITSVIIGPHPYQDKQEEALKILRESLKSNFNIRISGIPYRV
jgi:hypothetical protein